MGADDKSLRRKCGEILINIKSCSKKTKVYTYNCAFCNENCDQLKKFSIHIESKHLHEFTEKVVEDEEKPTIIEPEVKVEELLSTDTKLAVENLKEEPLYEDPLEATEVVVIADLKTNPIPFDDIQPENDENYSDMDYVNENDQDDGANYTHAESVDLEDDAEKKKPKSKVLRRRKKEYKSDASTDSDSGDADFKIKKLKEKKSKKTAPTKETGVGKEVPLLQAFEKHPYLWKVKERTSDMSIIQKGFEAIAKEINETYNCNISWNVAKRRITEMRVDYSNELEKQRNGSEHEMPWYSEHMKYLQENIDSLLKCRYEKSKYRRLLKMDETHLSILIELYRKHEVLWNVTNICFGLKFKREEVFNEMREDLKVNHNLDITLENLHRRINYMKRLYAKDKELQFKCELDKSEFKPTSSFFEQMSFLQHSHGPFMCSHCNEIIEKYDNYHIHVAKHDNTMPFICTLCGKGYKRFEQLLLHARGHLGLYNHECSLCGKSYHSRAEFDYHMTSHTGAKPFLCQVCGANFRALHEYDNHIRRHEKRYRFECEICKHGFNHLHKYNDHVKSHLNIRDVLCNTCGKAFTTKKNLRRHAQIHDVKKRFKCHVCDKEFAQDAGLRAHRKLHQPHIENKIKNEYIS